MISARTKAALAAARKRGVKLGGHRPGAKLTAAGRAKGREKQARIAAQRAAELAPAITDLRGDGATTLRAIAAGLNERGIPASNGGQWGASQVARILARL